MEEDKQCETIVKQSVGISRREDQEDLRSSTGTKRKGQQRVVFDASADDLAAPPEPCDPLTRNNAEGEVRACVRRRVPRV